MPETQLNNKRIAKNTIMLYIRMILVMGVSLFTTRVVLNTLGVEDYGIYNVVGGVVAMFGFISSAMSSATQRYITFALGDGDSLNLRKVFSISLQIHVLIAAVVLILVESIGLWFLYNKLQIPPSRLDATFWVFQLSIISAVVMIISVPYNAIIIAHERMSAFAYISVVEVILRLIIVYLLLMAPFDKLVFYAFLMLAVQVLTCFIYTSYCHKNFKESYYLHHINKNLFKEMTSFAGWSLFGNLSYVLFTQGLNLLLNIFFGPVVNAARGIAVQVQGAVQQFVGSFQTALNPQIIKTYAQNDHEAMHILMFRSARFSFFLLLMLVMPVIFEAEFILTLWLKIVPENTIIFLRIMLCTTLIYSLANPMMVANQATGKVKKYQAICGTMLIMILPISWLCLELGLPAYSVFIVHFAVEATTQLFRMILLRPLIKLRIQDYAKNIYMPVVLVSAISIICPYLMLQSLADGWIRLFSIVGVCILSVSISAYFLGITKGERSFINEKLKTFLIR